MDPILVTALLIHLSKFELTAVKKVYWLLAVESELDQNGHVAKSGQGGKKKKEMLDSLVGFTVSRNRLNHRIIGSRQDGLSSSYTKCHA